MAGQMCGESIHHPLAKLGTRHSLASALFAAEGAKNSSVTGLRRVMRLIRSYVNPAQTIILKCD
jgi:hypothetical protein